MTYLIYLSSISLFIYLVILTILIYYWKKTKVFVCPDDFSPSTVVSIIVPVRNEAENIQLCLDSLARQNYPQHLFEIIVVDDQSYDDTPDILEEASSHPNIKCMRLGVENRTTIEGSKKKAIAYGVNHAIGELIITTDGDCLLSENWIRTIVAYYTKTRAKLIVCPVLIDSKKGLFNAFQSLDFMSTFLIQAAGISSGMHYLCSGANLAYQKEAFLYANPYENNLNIASGDDIFLIQKFKKLYRGKIKVLKSIDAICITRPELTVALFMSQRLRWASKMKLSSNFSTILFAGVIWFQKLIPWVFLALSVLINNQYLILLSTGMLIVGVGIDFILLYSASIFCKKEKLLWWFLPAEITHSIYYFFLGILSWLPIPLNWKDRKIS